jgi:medium-chain acyl-[acyl-carrier-protein] hydrolase
LVTDREHYNLLARESRSAALDYAANLSVLPFESYLEALIQKPQRERGPKPQAPLSDDKRKLLALRMKQAAARKSNLWFQNVEQSAPLRLFCFPFAGGGTLLYRSWMEAVKPHAAICPACLPGRESRLNEPAIDRMDTLLDALEREIGPYLGTPFTFYGHSMGAIIAFELARRLERDGRPLPKALYVSGARAPQFRLGHRPPPEPSDSELMEELRKLEGMPREVLENPALLGVAMPALRADTRLYRNYFYQPGAPLRMPVYAYGGTTDPNVQRRHIEAWKEQTTGQFTSREFAGGHFFIQSAQKDFLESLISDIGQLSLPES